MAPSALLQDEDLAPPTSGDLTSYEGYAYVHWYVGNAKQAASYYVTRMGFENVAYRGLETGSSYLASHVIRNGGVTFVFTSPLRARNVDGASEQDRKILEEIHTSQERHGDAVKGRLPPWLPRPRGSLFPLSFPPTLQLTDTFFRNRCRL